MCSSFSGSEGITPRTHVISNNAHTIAFDYISMDKISPRKKKTEPNVQQQQTKKRKKTAKEKKRKENQNHPHHRVTEP